MEQVTIYNQAGQMLAVLDNADEISYDLKHNDLWTASFTLPSDDAKNDFCAAHNLARITDGSRSLGLYRIISMPSSEETAAGGTKTYNLEHVMATLLDDVLFGYHEIGGTGIHTRTVMQYILERQTVARWQLGTVEFDDQYQYHFENVSLLSALLSLGEVLTEEYTWDFDTSTSPWTVNLRKADTATGCGIYYGRNLVGIEKTMDASALITRLYPLGYGEGVNQLTIKDVNGGVPYIDADTAATWGIKCSVWTDTRLEDAATLLARARQVLEGYKNPYITYTAKAVDLYRQTGYAWDNFMPGKRVDVQDGEHGITFQARIVEISKKDVNGDPGGIEITIANAPRDAADSINTLADRVGIGELYSQGATNQYAQTFADNADESHPAKMRVFVPSGLVRINKMLLSWQLAPFRAYETGAEAGGSTTQTSSSGGSSTETTSSTTDVTYTSETGGQCTATSSVVTVDASTAGQIGTVSGPLASTAEEGNQGNIYTGKQLDDNGTYYSVTTGSNGAHTHVMSHHHNISGHSHTVDGHTHGMAHHHNISGHSHTVDSHSHTLNSHTHTLGSHTHGMAHHHNISSHSHTVDSHSHGLNSHTHSLNSHTHSFSDTTSFQWGHTHSTSSNFKAGNDTGGVNNYAAKSVTVSGTTGQSSGSTGSASGSTGTSSPSTDSVSLSTAGCLNNQGVLLTNTDAASGNTGAASGDTGSSSPGTDSVSLKTAGCMDNDDTLLTKTGSSSPGTDSVSLKTAGCMDNDDVLLTRTESDGAHTHTVPDHKHAFDHFHTITRLKIPSLTVNVPNHGHNVKIPGHSHSVNIPAHSHSLTLPDHSHGMVYGIYEGPTASGVTIQVDGNTVPAAQITGREIDVSAYLTKDNNGKITRNSWHEIRIIPDQLTRIEATLFSQVFIQSVGGGDY